MPIQLSEHDKEFVSRAENEIKRAFAEADMPAAAAKRIASIAMKYRNKGRNKAIRNYPFRGICEVSGRPLSKDVACLDELEPEKGYLGKVRWVCPKANNSGMKSCGGC